jgi:hypothetical protein
LADPIEAKVVRGEKNGMPVTDGIFPESKEFLLGYWIVDVAKAERAYAIAGQIFRSSRTRGQTHEHADRSAAVRELRVKIALTDVENLPRSPT